MKLAQLILEGITYRDPDFAEEWMEAQRYPEFKKMGKQGWIDIAKKGYVTPYSKIKNILGNVDLKFDKLDPNKKHRFQDAFKKGTIEMSIAVKFSDKDYDLVAGNTRLSGLAKNGIDPKIWIVDISNLQENYADTDTKLTVLSVIDGKRNLDTDQIRQLFDDSTGGTFYIYTNEEGEYENTKPVSRQDAYKYIDYYNARLKKDYKKEEELGAELGVLGIESELQFNQGEFRTDPTVFSKNENYSDGKVKGKSKPGRVKKSGASCKGSVTDLRAKAKKYGGEKGKMYHWCANMKGGRKK